MYNSNMTEELTGLDIHGTLIHYFKREFYIMNYIYAEVYQHASGAPVYLRLY